MDLDRLKEKASAAAAKREENKVPASARKKKKIGRWRILVWVVEALVLAIVFEQFVWRPRVARQERGGNRETRESADTPAALLGEEALWLPGLREVATARLPEVRALAPGAISAQAAQVQVSQERKLPIEVENSIGMRFRLIPNGTFIMGSPVGESGRWEGERQHVREIGLPFYMGKFEVTQAQWKAIMGSANNPSGFFGSRNPVEEVRWYDCQRFLIALCEKEGVPTWTYRLPAEADWEYACRAGALTAYHFGDAAGRLEKFDYFSENSDGRPHACGQLRPNAFGLYDMHGNVWEWCRDVYGNYPGCELPDPTDGNWRVIRGGNFHVGRQECRSAERARLPPASRGNILGFRVMRVLPELFDNPALASIPALNAAEKQVVPAGETPAPPEEEESP